MSLSFILWAMAEFNSENFIFTGKTIGSLRRNVIAPLKRMLIGRNIQFIDHRADNMLEVSYLGHTDYFYLFGGKDEGSQDLIQGITGAGLYADEVALQPESFINQAVARCSVDGAKLWFNCNPESPHHWFYTKWIKRAKELGLYVLHFLMDDNPSLTEATKARYIQLYAPGSLFYKRFIQGLWCIAEGAIFPFFSDDLTKGYIVDKLPEDLQRWVVSMDYGQEHPTVMALIGYSPSQKRWVLVKEHYTNRKPNPVYSKEFGSEFKRDGIVAIEIDPGGGGVSLIEQLRADYPELMCEISHAVKQDVVAELQELSTALYTHRLVIYQGCQRIIQEIYNYVWNDKVMQTGKEEPLKLNDDGIDALRYGWNRVLRLPT